MYLSFHKKMRWLLVPFTRAGAIPCDLFFVWTHMHILSPPMYDYSFNASRSPLDLFLLINKVHMKPPPSMATCRDATDMIFRGWISRTLATSQIEKPHFAVTAAVRIVCFVARLVALAAILFSSSALITPAKISY